MMYTKEMAIEDGGHKITSWINCPTDPQDGTPVGFIDTNLEVASEGTKIEAEIHWYHLYDLKSVFNMVYQGDKSPESCELHVDREKHCAKFTFIMPNNDITIMANLKRKEE